MVLLCLLPTSLHFNQSPHNDLSLERCSSVRCTRSASLLLHTFAGVCFRSLRRSLLPAGALLIYQTCWSVLQTVRPKTHKCESPRLASSILRHVACVYMSTVAVCTTCALPIPIPSSRCSAMYVGTFLHVSCTTAPSFWDPQPKVHPMICIPYHQCTSQTLLSLWDLLHAFVWLLQHLHPGVHSRGPVPPWQDWLLPFQLHPVRPPHLPQGPLGGSCPQPLEPRF